MEVKTPYTNILSYDSNIFAPEGANTPSNISYIPSLPSSASSSQTEPEPEPVATLKADILCIDDKKIIGLVNPENMTITECVVKYTINDRFIEPYKKEATNYINLVSMNNNEVIKMYNSGTAKTDKHGKCIYTLEEKDFKVWFPYEENNYYLILEYNKNYLTLGRYINNNIENIENIKKILYLICDSIKLLHNKYSFFHCDLKYDNVMINTDEKGKCIGIKNFDFDLSFSSPTKGIDFLPQIENYNKTWSEEKPEPELAETYEERKNKYKTYLFLFDIWRLWVSIVLFKKLDIKSAETREFKNLKFSLNDFWEYKETKIKSIFKVEEWNGELMYYDTIEGLYNFITTPKSK